MFRIQSAVKYSLLVFVFGLFSITAAAQYDDAPPLISWHPDGAMLALTSLEGVKILNADTLETLNEIPGTIRGMTPGFVVGAEWSPDGTRIALFNDMTVEIWESPWSSANASLVTTAAILAIPKGLSWSPNGTQIAIAHVDTLLIADTTSGEITDEFNREWSTIWRLIWPSDDKIVLTSTKRLTAIVHPETGQITTSYFRQYVQIVANTAIAFSPDMSRIAIGDDEGVIDIRNDTQATSTRIEPVAGVDKLLYVPPHIYTYGATSVTGNTIILDLDWSFDGRYLASASDDGTVRVWNPDTGENLTTITIAPGAWVGSAAWRPNSLELAYGNLDGTVTILVPDNVVPAPDALPTPNAPED